MADKIRNINDYRKTEDTERKDMTSSDTGQKDLQQNTSGNGSEADVENIRIEDPFVFLSAEERAEYLKVHQETIMGRDPQADEKIRKATLADQEEPDQEEEEELPETKENGGLKGFFSFRRDRHRQEDDFYAEDPEDEAEEDEQEDDVTDSSYENDVADDDFEEEGTSEEESEEYSDEESEDGREQDRSIEDAGKGDLQRHRKNPAPEKVVRIASTVTGILILLVLLFIVKVRLIDPFLAGRDDSDGTEFATDTVSGGEQVVTTNGLNLRSSPSSSSKDNIVATVSAGTTLTRTGEKDGWSEIEYNGQTVYCASKFLQAQK
ncbi:MAG: SH3 domain-containing protein [Butyrivibrio sp.]|nr:SH3 domain-containing protein [Butyrivibrio sp.]